MKFEIPYEVGSGATFSEPEPTHRYNLWRIWDVTLPLTTFILLNPSKAGKDDDDMTVTKTCGFARRNGFGGVIMVNMYAFVSKFPDVMFQATDPVA